MEAGANPERFWDEERFDGGSHTKQHYDSEDDGTAIFQMIRNVCDFKSGVVCAGAQRPHSLLEGLQADTKGL